MLQPHAPRAEWIRNRRCNFGCVLPGIHWLWPAAAGRPLQLQAPQSRRPASERHVHQRRERQTLPFQTRGKRGFLLLVPLPWRRPWGRQDCHLDWRSPWEICLIVGFLRIYKTKSINTFKFCGRFLGQKGLTGHGKLCHLLTCSEISSLGSQEIFLPGQTENKSINGPSSRWKTFVALSGKSQKAGQ